MVRLSEVGEEFYLLRSKEEQFHRNIYFKRFKNGKESVNMIFDPGTKLDGEQVMEASNKLFGGIQNINLIFLSHQDPDVSSLTSFIMAAAKRSILITSIDTFRLVSMYGISEKRTLFIEDFTTEVLTIKKTGHKVRFVPAYYCHFRGAMMFYDYESQVLFSGDFLGGLNTRKGEGIFANDESWEGIKIFHTIYMPSTHAVKETVNRIGLLDPIPEIIAPQHGDVIGDRYVIDFLTKLSELEVGIEHLKKTEPQKQLLLEALTFFGKRIKSAYPEEWGKLKVLLQKPGQFTSVFKIEGDRFVDIKIDPMDALKHLIVVSEKTFNSKNILDLKTYLNFALESHNVMLPPSISSKLQGDEYQAAKNLKYILD